MSVANHGGGERRFTFDPTPAVAASRARTRYIDCPVCESDRSDYLFHRTGLRFVRCHACKVVYVNPVGNVRVNYFDIDRSGQYAGTPADRASAIDEFDEVLAKLAAEYERVEGKPLTRVVLLGRYLPEFASTPTARRVQLKFAEIGDDDFRKLVLDGDLGFARELLAGEPQLVILKELLEACSAPGTVLQRLRQSCPPGAWFAVDYSNVGSTPAVLLRRYWPQFFDFKNTYFDSHNLDALMARAELGVVSRFPYPSRRTVEYVLRRVAPKSKLAALVASTPLKDAAARVRTGHDVAVYRPTQVALPAGEKLSIVFPVFNEARYVAQVIEAILAKPLKIERELIIVESNSTDGTRDIIKTFEGRPGVKVVYEDRPQGKGHAVRSGLAAVSGSIVLIQDADFEYDIEDYDALLEPILQHKTTFVLGSRSLGVDDWKVRKFATGHTKAFLLNFAQLVFARTFNALYQQNVTDVNTMFKVFRSEALSGLDLQSNGFELDIELACKLVRNGHAPMEVPVNYVARGFDEGKKISFLRDSWVSYFAFFQHRF